MTWSAIEPALLIVFLALLTLLVTAEARASRWSLPVKMVLSTGFVALAIRSGALESVYGRLLLLALLFSWLGDLLLGLDGRAPGPWWFLGGVVAFALAHIAFVVAFAARGVSASLVAVGSGVMIGVAVFVLRWLRPHLDGPFARAIPGYVGVIGLMVAFAVGTAHPTIWIPATLFAVSDIAVARNSFVAPGWTIKLWGLPFYFAAQYALALPAMEVTV